MSHVSTVIKKITIELGASDKAKEALEKGEIEYIPEERVLIYTRESRKWEGKDGLFPSELQLVYLLDKARQEWKG